MILLLAVFMSACGTDPQPLTCAEGELLDGDTCVPEACGTGTWGDLETDSATIYVDASAQAGGDGSKEKPFTLIQEGLDAQGKSGMVAVAAGTYVENPKLTGDHSGVHLAGRCMELVVLDGSEGSESNLEEGSGLYARGPGLTNRWTLSDLTVTGAPQTGILHYEGNLEIERVSVIGNRSRGLQSYFGVLRATDCTFQGNTDVGVLVAGSAATLQDVQVLDTQLNSTGADGVGIATQEGTLTATDCLVQGNHEGIFLGLATATLERVQVLDTLLDDQGDGGYGLSLDMSSLDATDCVLQDNQDVGVTLVGESTATLEQCVVQGNRDIGVYIFESTATLQNVQVLDTRTNWIREGGWGIEAMYDSSLVATDCVVQGQREVGLFVEDSSATLERVQILETRRGYETTAAFGLVSQQDATVDATELTIRDTDGPAIYASIRGQLICTDCSVTESAFAGAVIQGAGELILRDSLIEATAADANAGGGLGVFVNNAHGASLLTMENSTVHDNPMGAVYLRGAGTHQLNGNDLSGGEGLSVGNGLWTHGDSVFVTSSQDVPGAWDEEEQLGLLLEDNSFSDSAGAAVFLDGASATLAGNSYEGNSTDLVRQACGETEAPVGMEDESLSTTELCPDYDYATNEVGLSPYLRETEAEN